jgi:hypothetical protein
MSESNFRSGVRSSVRGFWNGSLSRSQFKDALASVIKRNLTNAFNEGAKECGIAASELTDDELSSRDDFIEEQIGFIGGFADAIREGDKVSGEKLQPLFDRAEMWVNRYKDIRNRAKVTTCKDAKLEWRLGATERHCADCSGYNGKVYRASLWAESDIRPQHPRLSCHGYRCLCTLVKTDKRASQGKPKGMTG